MLEAGSRSSPKESSAWGKLSRAQIPWDPLDIRGPVRLGAPRALLLRGPVGSCGFLLLVWGVIMGFRSSGSLGIYWGELGRSQISLKEPGSQILGDLKGVRGGQSDGA